MYVYSIMKAQILSDIHLEYLKEIPDNIEPKCDLLILPGDIINKSSSLSEQFLEYVNNNWKKVFIVLGNHEYYNMDSKTKTSYDEFKKYYSRLFSNYKNITFLDKTITTYNGRRIIGCTLWSKILDQDAYLLKNIYDDNGEKIDTTFIQDIYKEESLWLKENMKCNDIVITHYPTTRHKTSHPKFKNQTPVSHSCVSTELKANVKNCVFICGHTHYSFDFELDNNRYISNQKGYENENAKFDANKVYDI